MAKKKKSRPAPLSLPASKKARQALRDQFMRVRTAQAGLDRAYEGLKGASDELTAEWALALKCSETLQRLRELADSIATMTDEHIVDALEYWLNEQVVATVEGDGCDLARPGPGLNDREGLDPSTLIV